MHILGNPALLFPSPYVLSDRGIRESLDNGRLKVDDFEDNQVQPVSLDLRIGEVSVFDAGYRMLEVDRMYGAGLDYEPSSDGAIDYPDEAGRRISIPPRSWVEIRPHENIETDFGTRVDLRSSRGRLGLKIESFQDGVLSIRNYNPNTVRLYGRTPFAQMFFHPESNLGGRIVSDVEEVRSIGKLLGVDTYGPYLLFQLGEHAFRFKGTEYGVVDTRKSDDKSYYDQVEIKDLFVPPGEMVVAQLEPRIEVPNNIAIQLIDTPYVQNSFNLRPDDRLLFCESARSNAGFIDPEYNGNVTVHLRNTKWPDFYNRGDDVVLGVVSSFDKPVLRGYGHPELNSHYQGSKGSVSRS